MEVHYNESVSLAISLPRTWSCLYLIVKCDLDSIVFLKTYQDCTCTFANISLEFVHIFIFSTFRISYKSPS